MIASHNSIFQFLCSKKPLRLTFLTPIQYVDKKFWKQHEKWMISGIFQKMSTARQKRAFFDPDLLFKTTSLHIYSLRVVHLYLDFLSLFIAILLLDQNLFRPKMYQVWTRTLWTRIQMFCAPIKPPNVLTNTSL